jgi:GT2 family glycosyltransferase
VREIQSPKPYDTDWIEGCCILLRPAALDDVGTFDEAYFMYFEEVDLCHRLRNRGWRVRLVPTTSVLHPKPIGHFSPDYCYYMTRNGYRFRAKNFGVGTAAASLETVRSSFWLTALALASVLLPTRWNEARARWRDCWLQLEGAWLGTRDHLSGRYGRRASRPHPN